MLRKPVMDLGPVGQTRVHDYQRLFIAVLVCFAFGIVAIVWWKDGYLARLVDEIGAGFTISFTAMLLLGIGKSLWDIGFMSRVINMLKSTTDPRDQLKRMFDVDLEIINDRDSLNDLRSVVERDLNFRVWVLNTAVSVATLFGLLGTVVGMAEVALRALASVEFKLEAIQGVMPKVFSGFFMSMQTTVVGIYVALVLIAMLVIVRWTKMSLEKRLPRVFSVKR